MSQISILGLGLMGSALARTLQKSGHEITVWNRSPEKMKPFAENGANAATDPVSALRASPVILICVDNYAVTRRILGSEDVLPHLPGKTVIQLSTLTPLEAHQSELWFGEQGVVYIDGAILGGPGNIGTKHAQILYAGPSAAFETVKPLIECLAGNTRYLGENIRSAAALDLAWLCQRYALFVGIAHGALLCESEGVAVDLYASMFPQQERSHEIARTIHLNQFENPSATLDVWEAALKRIQKQALDAEINNNFPEFVSSVLKKAQAAGYGEEDVMAVIKAMRADREQA